MHRLPSDQVSKVLLLILVAPNMVVDHSRLESWGILAVTSFQDGVTPMSLLLSGTRLQLHRSQHPAPSVEQGAHHSNRQRKDPWLQMAQIREEQDVI